MLSVFLRVATTNNTGQNFFFFISFSIHFSHDGRERWCQWASMTGSPVSLHFPADFVTGGRQNCTGKAKFMGSQSKHYWHHYSIAITLLHNDTLQKKNMSIVSLPTKHLKSVNEHKNQYFYSLHVYTLKSTQKSKISCLNITLIKVKFIYTNTAWVKVSKYLISNALNY